MSCVDTPTAMGTKGIRGTTSADAALLALWRLARTQASRWCPPGQSPDDIAQEVLLAYVRQRSTISSPRAWIALVARRIAAKHRAKASRAPQSGESEEARSSLPDIQIDLRRALRQLDPLSRKLLSWTARGDTHTEIAARLGCARRDVGTLVARARARAAKLSGGAFIIAVSKRRFRTTRT